MNRPPDPADYGPGNAGLTRDICARLAALGRAPLFILSSSIQAEQDNPYGQSKRLAEEAVAEYAVRSGAPAIVFRLTNVFGKWCRPNYNSVVATFCHNVAHDLPLHISDPAHEVRLIYIDDVVDAFLRAIAEPPPPATCAYRTVEPVYPVALGALADLIRSFRAIRSDLFLPDLADRFTRVLYSTYLSYLEPTDWAYPLEQHTDPRGALAEFVKHPDAGQIFVSRTRPGITRGNHYHHTKTEKFLVLEGSALIRLRHVRASSEVVEIPVTGKDFCVVDIPPGYTHSIENVGEGELITLFWAVEPFDPAHPDTYPMQVIHD